MPEIDQRRKTFTRLMDEFGAALQRLAGAYLSDPTAREDLFQEIALAMWIGIPGFRGEASERTWVYRIAHNTAATQLHQLKRRRQREQQLQAGDHEPAAPVAGPADLEQSQQRERFLAALRQLPTLDFQIVTMHLDGLSYAEIATVTGLTQTNVGARLTRIRQALSANLAGAEASR